MMYAQSSTRLQPAVAFRDVAYEAAEQGENQFLLESLGRRTQP